MTLVVGVDPSARKIAFVVTDTVLGVSRVFAYPLYKTGSQTPESLGKAADAVADFLGEIAPMMSGGGKTAWVETPFVGQRARGVSSVASTIKQAYVRGIVVGALVQAGFRTYDVHQSTWKAWLGVSPSNKEKKSPKDHKADIARVLSVRHPKIARLTAGDVDLTDAGAICLYGADQGATPPPRALPSRPARRRVQAGDGG